MSDKKRKLAAERWWFLPAVLTGLVVYLGFLVFMVAAMLGDYGVVTCR